MRLLEVKDIDGNCLAVCDARCYNAGSPLCCCVCGGENHGIGHAAAAVKTKAHHTQWTELFQLTLPVVTEIQVTLHESLRGEDD